MRRAALTFGLLGVLVLIGCLSESVQESFGVGTDLLYEGRYQDAESHFLVLARELSKSPDEGARVWRAKALYQAGLVEHLYLDQPRRAVARLREALKLTPHGNFAFDARRDIALIFHDKLKDYRSAALEFERLVQAFPDRKGIEEYQYRIAQSYFVIRDFSQARTEARLLMEKHADSPIVEETMLLIANSYYVEGRFQEATEAHRQLLAKHPKEEIESRSLFELGMCYQELGDYQKAEQNLLMALKIHPRPDLVQLQLTSLGNRVSEEGSKAKQKLPYATAGRVGSGIGSVERKTPETRPKLPEKGKEKTAPPKPKETKAPAETPPVAPGEEPKGLKKSGEEKKVESKPEPPTPEARPAPAPPAEEKAAPEKPPKKPTPAAAPDEEKPSE